MDNADERRCEPNARRRDRAILATVRFAGLSLVAGALPPTVSASDAVLALVQLPVAGTRPVVAADYRAAQDVARRGGTPVEIALAAAGPFEGATQAITQANEGAEAPTASRVTVLRDGLLDDAVRGERWDVRLQRAASGGWVITEVTRAWRCRRGALPDRFAAVSCP